MASPTFTLKGILVGIPHEDLLVVTTAGGHHRGHIHTYLPTDHSFFKKIFKNGGGVVLLEIGPNLLDEIGWTPPPILNAEKKLTGRGKKARRRRKKFLGSLFLGQKRPRTSKNTLFRAQSARKKFFWGLFFLFFGLEKF